MDLVPVQRSIAIRQGLSRSEGEYDIENADFNVNPKDDTLALELSLVHENVLDTLRAAAEFNFDFFMLVVVASLLAGKCFSC